MFVHEIVEENGKTIRENNMGRTHNIPKGTLVEVFIPDENLYTDDSEQTNGLRLWVVSHDRDCDGTPLYGLSFDKTAQHTLDECRVEENSHGEEEAMLAKIIMARIANKICRGYAEESLIVIQPPAR